jgi:hypothetical protein
MEAACNLVVLPLAISLLALGCVRGETAVTAEQGAPSAAVAQAASVSAASAGDAAATSVPEAGAREWHLKGAAYAMDFLDVRKETTNTRATDFNPEGTMLFVLGRGSMNVVSYKLRQPWHLSGGEKLAEFSLREAIGHTAQYPVPHGLYMRPSDGRAMYVWNRTEIYGFRLATPWDITTAQTSGYAYLGEWVTRGHDIDFKADGTRLYVDDRGTGEVHQFNLSKPWYLPTLSHAYTLDVANLQRAMRGIQLSDNGRRMFFLDTNLREVFEFSLATPWEIKSATHTDTLDLGGRFKSPTQITWRPDGRAFFVTETFDRSIHAFSVP